jgi:hypothetical protein
MGFDPARYPNAVTLSRYREEGLRVSLHCFRCGRIREKRPTGI